MKTVKTGLQLILMVVIIAFSTDATAQCGTFNDASIGVSKAKENHVLYRDALKMKDWATAQQHWEIIFKEAPAADGKRNFHYTDGRTILKHFFDQEADATKKEALKNRILGLYDSELGCYPKDANGKDKTGFIKGRKAYDMFYYYQGDYQEIFDLCAESAKISGDATEYVTIRPWATTAVYLYTNELMDKETARNAYDQMMEVCNANIKDGNKFKTQFETEKQAVVSIFNPIERNIFDCDFFVNKLKPIYDADKDNPTVYRDIYKQLAAAGCSKETNSIMAEIAAKDGARIAQEREAQRLEYLANNPAYVGNQLLKEKNYSGAVAKFQEALNDPALTDENKASLYYSIASAQRQMKSYSNARQNALKAAKLKPNWGKPYILIGDMYASSSRSCGSTVLKQQFVALAAIDKYSYAKRIDSDPEVQEKAQSRINRLSGSYPSSEDAFMAGYKNGSSYKIGCWIGETVKVRTK